MGQKIIIGGIFAFIALAIVLSLRWHFPGKPLQSHMPMATPTPTPPASTPQTMLKLIPEEVDGKGNVIAEVFMNSGENRVTAVHMVVGYDPKVLTVMSVNTTDFLGGKTVLAKKIDPIAGSITFGAGIDTAKNELPIQGADAMVKIVFRVNNVTAKTTTLTFLPGTTASAEGIQGSSVIKLINASVPLITQKQ